MALKPRGAPVTSSRLAGAPAASPLPPPPSPLSYAPGVSDVPLLGDTTGDNFDRTVAGDPDREALVEVSTGRRWTYAQLRAEVGSLALGLLDARVTKGD